MSSQTQRSNEDELKIISTIQQLSSQGKYRSAMDAIFEILEEIPGDEFALHLANIVLYSGLARSQAYSALEPLTAEYIADSRLDTLFCECSNCKAAWVIAPGIDKYKSVTINNPLGGFCPRCEKIYCRNCAFIVNAPLGVGSPGKGLCPTCKEPLEIIKKATGRHPRQTARKNKPVKNVILLREGPIPPTPDYLTKIFKLASPDVLNDHAHTYAAPLPKWSSNTKEITSLIYAIAAKKGYSLNDIETFFSTDEYGNHFCIAKVY